MIKTRFAPTPSGYLHVGNAASFVLTWLLARAAGGKILLRIDDLDNERTRPEFVEDIFNTLDFLNLDYDEGPEGPDDFQKNWSQLNRIDHYESFLSKLAQQHNSVFACTCSRSQLPDGPYPGTCIHKGIPLTQSDTAWRLNTTNSDVIRFADVLAGPQLVNLNTTTGSFVIRSKNGRPAYQIASLADDLFYNINLIVRGRDLITSTACQLYIDSLLQSGFSAVGFVHHPLVVDAGDVKLSKSSGAASVNAISASGKNASLIYQLVAGWLGLQLSTLNTVAESQKDLLTQLKTHPHFSDLLQQYNTK
ncbi:MAG TPA: glutamate--tRNA ligase family protein [Bacteroidia bacterium]|nr:glutamate--tRNA ligase family protein [Bacteroidia bacterium]